MLSLAKMIEMHLLQTHAKTLVQEVITLIMVQAKKMVGLFRKGRLIELINRNRPLAGGTGEVPGPGNYQSCGTLSKQGYSYGKGSRNVGYDNAVPGPGMYDKKGTLDKHGSKFGRDTRNTLGKNDLNVGPGQYNHSKIGKNATSSFSFGKSVRKGIANEVTFINNISRTQHPDQEPMAKMQTEMLVAGVLVKPKDPPLTAERAGMK